MERVPEMKFCEPRADGRRLPLGSSNVGSSSRDRALARFSLEGKTCLGEYFVPMSTPCEILYVLSSTKLHGFESLVVLRVWA